MKEKKVGILGEKIAEKYLKSKGYQILDRNFTFRISGSPPKGEVDVVAKKGGTISFVEVKTQQEQASLIQPEEKVNFGKQKKLRIVAESWLMKNKIPLNSKWQIDVISIKIASSGKKAKIKHFKNAVGY